MMINEATIKATSLRYSRNDQDAEDIAQEARVAMWAQNEQKPKAFTFAVTRNKAAEYYRNLEGRADSKFGPRHFESFDPNRDGAVSDGFSDQVLGSLMSGWVESLVANHHASPKVKAMLRAWLFDGINDRRLAAAMGVTPAYVWQIKRRFLAGVRDQVMEAINGNNV
jgi:DNA-directed RNA polymerase specialized sigma24 family protein